MSAKTILLKRTKKELTDASIRTLVLNYGEPLYYYSEGRSYLVIGDGLSTVANLPVFSSSSPDIAQNNLYYETLDDGTVNLYSGDPSKSDPLVLNFASVDITTIPHATIDEKGVVTHAIINNINVNKNDWVDQGRFGGIPDYPEFPFRFKIDVSGCTENHRPEVIFNMNEATSGIYAPIARSVYGGVYIYAIERPEENIVIPTLELTA